MAYEHQDTDTRRDSLFVLNGELRGVSVRLESMPLRIGFADDCDVVLLDNDNNAATAVLRQSDDGAFSLETECGEVKVGGRYLKRQKVSDVPARTPMSIGSVKLVIARSFSDAERSVHLHTRRSVGTAWAASFAVALGVIGLIGLFAEKPAVSSARPAMVSTSESYEGKSAFMPSLAASALRERFDEVGLSRLKASADRRDRVVVVHGKLRPSETPRWIAAQSWFDSTYGDSVQLDPRLTTAADAVTLPFMVQAVWMGETPRLTLHDGSQRRAGDVLPGGWRLDGISVDKVKISKNGETLVVPL